MYRQTPRRILCSALSMDSSENRKSLSVFTSAVLHALLIGLIFWFFNLKPDEPPPGNDAIDVTTVSKEKNFKPKSVKQKKIVSTAPVNHSSHGERMVSLADLGMRLDRNPAPVASSSENSERAMPDAEDTPDEGWDVLNPDPKLARFNQYIYNTVQGWLDRDAYMNHQQLYGQVRVKLWFSADGEWLENETVYDAVDEDFIKIVQRALRKSFTNPIPRPYLFKHEKFSIQRTVVIRS
jgi:hypothetical protein